MALVGIPPVFHISEQVAASSNLICLPKRAARPRREAGGFACLPIAAHMQVFMGTRRLVWLLMLMLWLVVLAL